MVIPKMQVNESIVLKLVTLEDATHIFEAIIENRIFFRKWLPFIDATKSDKDTYTFIKSIIDDVEHRQEIFTIWFDGFFVGLIGLKEIDYLNRKAEIGYWLIEKMNGKGIITLSVQKLIQFVFEKMNFNRIQIKCGIGNTLSAAIPKRLGFVYEGTERQGERHSQEFLDLEIFSLLKEEWY